MTTETLRLNLPQPFISFIETTDKTIKDFVSNETFLAVTKTICEVATIVFRVIAVVILVGLNSTFAGIGAVFALFAPKLAADVCNRVERTWQHQSPLVQSLMVVTGVILFQVTSVISSFLIGAYICYKLQPVVEDAINNGI